MLGRLPAAVFAALAVATVGAFFLTQHLKVENPFINGAPRVDPPAINPLAGRVCVALNGKRISFKTARVGFYLQTSAQRVDVFVENSFNQVVATAGGSGRYIRPDNKYKFFNWDGKLPGGGVAPDGSYHFVVSLPSQDRTLPAGQPFEVITTSPQPVVSSVTATGQRPIGPPIIGPPGTAQRVTIHFSRGDYRNASIQIIRTDQGRPRVVFTYGAAGRYGETGWNGLINGRPAPAGTYLVGVRVVDQACNVGRFPPVADPPPGLTPHAGVTVRYLAALPPLVPVTAGRLATVYVDSRRQPYSWKLFAAGRPKVLDQGSVATAQAASEAGPALHVRMPPLGARVYELSVSSGSHRTAVPMIAAAGGRRAAAKVLLVLPALSWQGVNPVDDTGDGLPATLSAGERIDLERPLVGGLPAGLDGELGLLHFLERQRDAFQLTTDIALAEGVGPQLAGHTGVILDGSFKWLPAALGPRLRAFVEQGGHVVAVGTGSMQAQAPVGAGIAGPPKRMAVDPFGARRGAVVAHTTQYVIPLEDRLGIFALIPAFQGFDSYQPILPPTGAVTSEAGVATGVPAITGFRLGHGEVVEIGLPGFGATIAGNVDSQELTTNFWQMLSS